jgi:hypothetical protein
LGCVSDAASAVESGFQSSVAQTVKSVASTVSNVAGGVAVAAADVAIQFPVTEPVAAEIAAGAGVVSVAGQAVSTVIECLDGGAGRDCAEGIAFTLTGAGMLGVSHYASRYAGLVYDALAGGLEFFANGVQYARGQRPGC